MRPDNSERNFRLGLMAALGAACALVLLVGASAAQSQPFIERDTHWERAQVGRVVDGDTVDAEVFLGYDVEVKVQPHLLDVDTPELNARDPLVRLKALE